MSDSPTWQISAAITHLSDAVRLLDAYKGWEIEGYTSKLRQFAVEMQVILTRVESMLDEQYPSS